MRLVETIAFVLAVSSCGQSPMSSGRASPRMPASERELTTLLDATSHVVLIAGSGPDVYLAIAEQSSTGTTYATRSLIHHVPLWQAVFHFPVARIGDGELAAIPRVADTPFFDNVLLRADGSSDVYVTVGDQRHAYPDVDTMTARGVDPKSAHVVPDAALRELPQGASVERPQMYVFAIDNFHIDKTRARHRDTVAAISGIQLGDFGAGSQMGIAASRAASIGSATATTARTSPTSNGDHSPRATPRM